MRIHELALAILASITVFNLGVGCMLTIEKIHEKFGRKGNRWVYVYIIVTSLGIVAMKILLERN